MRCRPSDRLSVSNLPLDSNQFGNLCHTRKWGHSDSCADLLAEARRTYLTTSSSLEQEVNFLSPLLHAGMAIHQQARAFKEWSLPADLRLAIIAPIDAFTALKICCVSDERRFSSDPQRSLARL